MSSAPAATAASAPWRLAQVVDNGQSWFDALWLIASLHPTAPVLQVVSPDALALGAKRRARPPVTMTYGRRLPRGVLRRAGPRASCRRRARRGSTPVVAAAMERGFELVVLIFAASKLGARTLPLPPESPSRRRRVSSRLRRGVGDRRRLLLLLLRRRRPRRGGTAPSSPDPHAPPSAAVPLTHPPPVRQGDCDAGASSSAAPLDGRAKAHLEERTVVLPSSRVDVVHRPIRYRRVRRAEEPLHDDARDVRTEPILAGAPYTSSRTPPSSAPAASAIPRSIARREKSPRRPVSPVATTPGVNATR